MNKLRVLSFGVTLLCLYGYYGYFEFYANITLNEQKVTQLSTYEKVIVKQELEKSTTDNNTNYRNDWTLVLAVNDGFFDFFLNWFAYYKKLNLTLPIHTFAEDDKVYTKLQTACEFCTVINSHLNLTNASNYNTAEYNRLVSTRPHHILEILKTGRNVLYADIDAVWLQNPLPYLNTNADVIAQKDGDGYCTGFLAIRANDNTTEIVKQWHGILSKKNSLDQDVFIRVMAKNQMKVKGVLLDAIRFPDGRRYFKLYNDTQRAQAVIVHNNFIIGHDNKLNRFKKFGLWQI